MEISSGNPYQDTGHCENRFLRFFREDVDASELVWHRDYNDRKVEVIAGKGWKFQYDNQMPTEIKCGDILEIKAMEFHRLIKGNTELILRITEK